MEKCGPPRNQTKYISFDVLFIEFEPLGQKLLAFMSNFSVFMMPAPQIWQSHVTQEANFEKILFFPNSAFNNRKSYKISSRKALYFRSYQPKNLTGGGKHPLPSVLLGLSEMSCKILKGYHIVLPYFERMSYFN